MNREQIKNSKFVIYSHYSATGATEELRDWLICEKVKEVVYVAFPFSQSESKAVRVGSYQHGELVHFAKSLFRFKKPAPVSYAKDYFYGLKFGRKYAEGADFFIGGDNLLTLIGLKLRNKGYVKQVIYYMIDYTPVRYANTFLNNLYYRFDKKAAYGADYVWPLSERTIGGRFEDERLSAEKVNWFEVPYGNHSDVNASPLRRSKYDVVYMGKISKDKGAAMFVPLMKRLAEINNRFRLIIIGDGPYMPELRLEIQMTGLEAQFELVGFVEEFEQVLEQLKQCGIALAPYNPHDDNNFTYYADPGKIKVYLGCGLPIVMTDVPQIARTIQSEQAGQICEYDAGDIADKIATIIKDFPLYQINAKKLGLRYDWDEIFTKAFGRIKESNIEG